MILKTQINIYMWEWIKDSKGEGGNLQKMH